MDTLAQLTFDFLWLLMFSEEDEIDPSLAERWLESLPEYFANMSSEEKAALARVAAREQRRLLAEPDEYGYTPRKLVTDEQKEFMESLISGDIFEELE
jgi:hypothetical protein